MTWQQTLVAIAESKMSTAAHSRMLILAIVASNWVILNTLLLYTADLMTARNAVQFAVSLEIIVFSVYFIISRIPTVARQIQRIGDIEA